MESAGLLAQTEAATTAQAALQRDQEAAAAQYEALKVTAEKVTQSMQWCRAQYPFGGAKIDELRKVLRGTGE